MNSRCLYLKLTGKFSIWVRDVVYSGQVGTSLHRGWGASTLTFPGQCDLGSKPQSPETHWVTLS